MLGSTASSILTREHVCPQVPYSEHSSFEELRDMVATLQVLPASNYLTILTPHAVLLHFSATATVILVPHAF